MISGASEAASDSFRIFVGNLGSRMTETDLLELIKPFGPASCVRMVRDSVSGLSSGYAFVEMSEAGHARKAVSALNGKSVDGHTLIVRPIF